MKFIPQLSGARLPGNIGQPGIGPIPLSVCPCFLIFLASCAHPVGWTYTPFGPGVPTPAAATASGGPLNGWLPGARDVNAANHQAAQRAQQLPADDPLSLRYMPKQVGPDVHVSAARLFEVQGKADRAAAAYHEALKVQAEYEPALLGLARLYDRAGQWDQAEQWYRRAVELHPQSAAAHNDWAMCLARRGQLPQAVELWKRAVQHQPQEILYRNNLARGLVQLGFYQEAFQTLAAALPPAAAHYNMGYLLFEAGRKDLATVALNRSLQIDPAFHRAEKLLAKWTANGPQPTASHMAPSGQVDYRPGAATFQVERSAATGNALGHNASGHYSPRMSAPGHTAPATHGFPQAPSGAARTASLPSRYQVPSPLPQ